METSVPASDGSDGQCVYVLFNYRLEWKTEVFGETKCLSDTVSSTKFV